MAQIIEFKKRQASKVSKADKYKAIAKGTYQEFTCDSCGADIEVINGVYPEKCPGCGLRIAHWNSAGGE